MRILFKKIHLWLSIPFGLIISIISLTGAILVFEQDITRLINSEIYERLNVSEEDMERLPVQELENKIKQQLGDTLTLTAIKYAANSDEVCIVSFAGQKSTLAVNPYNGEVRGWLKTCPFFESVKKLHRWLFDVPKTMGGSSIGKTIVGISSLIMVVILISGLIIWFPRTKKVAYNRLKVTLKKGWNRFFYDCHVTLGFYSCIFLLLMSLTGPTWSFQWYSNAFNKLLGQEQNFKMEQKYAINTKEQSGFSNKKNPSSENAGNQTCIDNQKLQKEPRNNIKIIDAANSSSKGIFYSIHTGSWGGIFSKILYFIAAIIGGTLPLTGYWLWLKKKAVK